jgi:hypothetical protein
MFFNSLASLERVDWRLLRSRNFRRDPNDPGKFERYQAEALVHRHLPVSALLGLVCYGPEQEEKLNSLLRAAGISLKVVARPGWYFR